jgi:signal transduction histidine kinase
VIRSLRAQLFISILLAVIITITLTGVLSNIFINRRFESYVEKRGEARSAYIAEEIEHIYGDLSGWNAEALHALGMYALNDGYIIRVSDRDGNIVWNAETHDMELCQRVMDDIMGRMDSFRPNGSGGFVSRDYTLTRGGRQIGFLSISYYGPYFLDESDFQFLGALNAVLAVTAVFSFIFSFAAGLFMARRVSRPISKTSGIAKQIADGNYAIRFEGGTKTKELNELVSAVNHMASALEGQEKLRKRLTTDVAHELRTPLTTLGTHLEAMIDGVWEPSKARLKSCYEETERLSALVAELESLSKIESENLRPDKAPVDLADIARSVSEGFEIEMSGKNIRLGLKTEAAAVNADGGRLRQVVTNLISNAVKYTPDGGEINVSTGVSEDGGVFLTVSDNGVGIDENELPLIFERFYRADKSRGRKTGGAGIGLTIAKAIAEAHGGKISVKSRPGEGSEFTVVIPKG